MKNKLGIKAWSTFSAMLFSLVVISGCNNEDTPSTTTPPSNPVSPGKPGETAKPKMETATPPPPSATDKAKETPKDMPKP